MSRTNKSLVPVGLLSLTILCAVLIFADQSPSLLSRQPTLSSVAPSPQTVGLPTTQYPAGTYISVQPDTSGKGDLFYCTIVSPSLCIPLTQSPAVDETWPVLNADGDRIAYYAQSEGKVEVALLTLPPLAILSTTIESNLVTVSVPSTITVLTEQAGTSGLHIDYEVYPAIAPAFCKGSEQWIAFPGKSAKGNTVELFVAHTNGREVMQITDKDWVVRDYIWLDHCSHNSMTFLITFQRFTGKLEQWKAVVDKGEVQLIKAPTYNNK